MINAARNIGTKFNEDGTPRFYPGNTVISFLDHGTAAWEAFIAIRSMLVCADMSRCATLMPDKSIHMTVFEGVCHNARRPEVWTNHLPLDCRLEETDELMEKAIASVKPLGAVNMRMDHIYLGIGSSIQLVPDTEADAAELKRYRDECAAATGIRFPNHDRYEYHITMCYFTKTPDAKHEAMLEEYKRKAEAYIASKRIIFRAAAPTLTFFDNMFCFNPFRIPRNGL